MVSIDMCTQKERVPKINYVGTIMCLFVAFLVVCGCSKSGKDNATEVLPMELSVINESLKDYMFIRQHFDDPERVWSFLEELVALHYQAYQRVGSSEELRIMERSGLLDRQRGREKSEAVIRDLCSDPKVVLEGNKWKVVFNVFKRDGSIEKWYVVGENEPENEYNHINKIEIRIFKSKGTFSWYPVLTKKEPTVHRTQLHRAIRAGDTQRIRALISNGSDVNAKDEYGETPLHRVASGDRSDLAKILLANGADANSKDDLGNTPLHKSASSAASGVAELLISVGADVNAKNKGGRTPLHEIPSSFWEFDAFNDRSSKYVVELLIAKGADFNAKDKSGNTPLHEATASRRYIAREVVSILIAKGADVNAKDEIGDTPLHEAACSGSR